MAAASDDYRQAGDKPAIIPRSAYFALFVLVLANLFNLLDRQIVSILAQAIKADLRLDDAELGFLLGTAFAVFYSVVGIAMGRISDFVTRKKMLAIGLSVWSVMTALGGTATSFVMLTIARVGVGVGEAVANPCSHSLLSDIFPARNRSLVLGTYLAGTFLGGTAAMVLGGYFLQNWAKFCSSVPIASACGLASWKAALIAVGLPGLLLALLALTIQEPPRPLPQGSAARAGTWRIVLREISAALPPFTLLVLHRLAGRRGVLRNLQLVAVIALVAAGLIRVTGDVAQWAAFGLGAYAVATWGQVQSHADKPLYKLTFGDRTFVLCASASALVACMVGVFSVWAAPMAMRSFDLPPARLGLGLGVLYTGGALLGVVLGGWLTDKWKIKDRRAPLGMTAISVIGTIPSLLIMASANSVEVFFAGYFLQAIFTAMWSGGTAAMIQDLVLARMRGAAAASFSLISIVVGSGIGPYWTGKVSTMTGSLNAGLFSIVLLAPLALFLLWRGSLRLPAETAERRLAIARAAGEPVS